MRLLWTLAAAAAALLTASSGGVPAADTELIPPQFPREQRENLRRFLQQHEKPNRFIPANARLVGSQPPGVDAENNAGGKPIKQYMVQIVPHRPVPGQEEVKRADVVYYRPNPRKGKPGIAVRYTVDLTTGKQVGPTEVRFNNHTPLSREEVALAVALAREKSSAVQELYKQQDKKAVHWEYLQPVIRRPHGVHEPGDRVVRLVFTATAGKEEAAPAPVRVMVNLTKDVVEPEGR